MMYSKEQTLKKNIL